MLAARVARGGGSGSSRGRCRSRRPRRSDQARSRESAPARRPVSPRRVRSPAVSFFPGPAAVPGDHPTHRRMAHSDPGGLLPPLAVLLERRLGVLLHAGQQRGLQAGRLRSWWARPGRLRQTPRLPLSTPPARQRRRRDPEQPDHLRSGRPQIQRIERPDPQIPRIGLHAPSLTKRSPFTQGAVTLVLHDWGGPIGMSYALDRPGNVKRITVYNSWFWSVRGLKTFERFSSFM